MSELKLCVKEIVDNVLSYCEDEISKEDAVEKIMYTLCNFSLLCEMDSSERKMRDDFIREAPADRE